jgi:hypothetical protein
MYCMQRAVPYTGNAHGLIMGGGGEAGKGGEYLRCKERRGGAAIEGRIRKMWKMMNNLFKDQR